MQKLHWALKLNQYHSFKSVRTPCFQTCYICREVPKALWQRITEMQFPASCLPAFVSLAEVAPPFLANSIWVLALIQLSPAGPRFRANSREFLPNPPPMERHRCHCCSHRPASTRRIADIALPSTTLPDKKFLAQNSLINFESRIRGCRAVHCIPTRSALKE